MSDLFLHIGSMLKLAGFALSPLLLLPLVTLVLPRIFAPFATRLSGIIDRISMGALTLSIVLAILMVGAQLLVIIGRYLFDWSASWASEIIIYSFAGLFLLAAGSALKTDAHVRVDILRDGMNPNRKAVIDLAGIYLFLFPICIMLLWASISPSFIRSWEQFEGSRETDGLPIYFIFRTLVPLFAALLLTQGVSEALKSALQLRSPGSSPASEAS